MLPDNRVFYKSKSYLIFFCTSIGIHKRPSPRSLTNLYNLVYFDCRDQFNPSKGSSETWSDNYGQTS